MFIIIVDEDVGVGKYPRGNAWIDPIRYVRHALEHTIPCPDLVEAVGDLKKLFQALFVTIPVPFDENREILRHLGWQFFAC